MKRKMLGMAAALIFASYGVPAIAAERAPVTINLLSSPFGAGFYTISSALEQISKTHPWLRIVHSETPGFLYNFKKLGSEPEMQKTTIIGSGPVISALGTRGNKPFDKKYPGIQLLANYSLVSTWLVTLDQATKTVYDIQEKKLALGRVTQSTWAIEPKALIALGYGIPLDELDIQHVGPVGAMTALLDGTADVAVVGGYPNLKKDRIVLSPQTLELIASGRKIYHLGWTADAVKKTMAAGIPISPFTLSANSFDGLDKPLPLFVDMLSWTVSPNFPEDIAYEVTKLIIDNVDKFGNYTAVGKFMSREALAFGWPQDGIHPGALRAYREAGILK